MRQFFLSIAIWFLIIQSLGVDAVAITSVPMQNQSYCQAAIAALPPSGKWIKVEYFCIDAGDVSPL